MNNPTNKSLWSLVIMFINSLTKTKYFETKLTSKDISKLLNKINLKPIEITRKNEIIWKKKFSKMNLKEDQLIDVLSENPSLIERPIVEYENSGVLARPIENLISFDQKVGELNK